MFLRKVAGETHSLSQMLWDFCQSRGKHMRMTSEQVSAWLYVDVSVRYCLHPQLLCEMLRSSASLWSVTVIFTVFISQSLVKHSVTLFLTCQLLTQPIMCFRGRAICLTGQWQMGECLERLMDTRLSKLIIIMHMYGLFKQVTGNTDPISAVQINTTHVTAEGFTSKIPV